MHDAHIQFYPTFVIGQTWWRGHIFSVFFSKWLLSHVVIIVVMYMIIVTQMFMTNVHGPYMTTWPNLVTICKWPSHKNPCFGIVNKSYCVGSDLYKVYSWLPKKKQIWGGIIFLFFAICLSLTIFTICCHNSHLLIHLDMFIRSGVFPMNLICHVLCYNLEAFCSSLGIVPQLLISL